LAALNFRQNADYQVFITRDQPAGRARIPVTGRFSTPIAGLSDGMRQVVAARKLRIAKAMAAGETTAGRQPSDSISRQRGFHSCDNRGEQCGENAELERELATATGESVSLIRRRGFQLVEPPELETTGWPRIDAPTGRPDTALIT
jgi:hypothetical protein